MQGEQGGDLIKEGALLLLLFLLMISKRKRLMVESGEEQGGEQRCRRHVGGGEREGIPAGRGDEGDISTVIAIDMHYKIHQCTMSVAGQSRSNGLSCSKVDLG